MHAGRSRALGQAYDGGVWQLGAQACNERRLRALLERGEGIVEDDDAWAMDEQPGDSEALALAVREHLVPARHLVEPPAECREIHFIQCGPEALVGHLERWVGIEQRTPERPERQI